MTGPACRTRGFRLHLGTGETLGGAVLPSGRAFVVDDPEYGLASAAPSLDELLTGYHHARLEWAPDGATTALAEIRRLCELTISTSVRVHAIEQARDTLTVIDRIMGADPRDTVTEAEAAATLARNCPDNAAVIRWCADRTRATDDDPDVQDAADHLHDLAATAETDTTPVQNRAALIRWCAMTLHSMGGPYPVVRAAEYLEDLATEADEAQQPATPETSP
ncbi:hypothetical protein ACFXAZ_38445 [Streptomyces sp. NPDC059477]|uniref:hypothetical protein n=1 Tax=Streptomyces sp. NPDC059477 TaxID=3346847 RepID=UPI0036ADBCD2